MSKLGDWANKDDINHAAYLVGVWFTLGLVLLLSTGTILSFLLHPHLLTGAVALFIFYYWWKEINDK